MQNPPPAEPTWEELFDSGQLEQQISQINFGQHVPSPPLQLNQQRPQQGLIMTPLLPDRPQQQALIMPPTAVHHPFTGNSSPHAIAMFSGTPSPMPNHTGHAM